MSLWGTLWNGGMRMANGEDKLPRPQSPIPNPQPRIWLTFALVFTLAWVGVNHAFAFVDPDPAHPVWFEQVRVADLAGLVPAQQTRLLAEPAIFLADGDKASLGLDLPDQPLFLWIRPQAVGESAHSLRAAHHPQPRRSSWSGRAPAARDDRLPLDAMRSQTVAIILSTSGGSGQHGPPPGFWPGRPIRGNGDGERDNLPAIGQDFFMGTARYIGPFWEDAWNPG